MELRRISIKRAMPYVDEWHRHLDRPQGAIFAIAARHEGRIVGVALVGNPIARLADDGETAEVIRVATDGTQNACSFLYARAKRAAQALGFISVITKTLPEESGASLRAVGATYLGESRAQQWDRAARRRAERPMTPKRRWKL